MGGVKEKVIAAHRAGIRRVILPEKNEKDLLDLPKSVRDAMSVVFVTDVQQVLDAALLPPEAMAEAPSASAGPPPFATGVAELPQPQPRSAGDGGELPLPSGEVPPLEPPRLASPSRSLAVRLSDAGERRLRAVRGASEASERSLE